MDSSLTPPQPLAQLSPNQALPAVQFGNGNGSGNGNGNEVV